MTNVSCFYQVSTASIFQQNAKFIRKVEYWHTTIINVFNNCDNTNPNCRYHYYCCYYLVIISIVNVAKDELIFVNVAKVRFGDGDLF